MSAGAVVTLLRVHTPCLDRLHQYPVQYPVEYDPVDVQAKHIAFKLLLKHLKVAAEPCEKSRIAFFLALYLVRCHWYRAGISSVYLNPTFLVAFLMRPVSSLFVSATMISPLLVANPH
jgi:hypothetical protein